MSATSRAELAGRAARLAKLAGSVNPANLTAALTEATTQMGEIPGSPNGLEDLTAAFRQARAGLRTVGEDTRLTGQSRLQQAWMSGEASERAATATTTAGDQLRDGGEPLGVVADAMDHLADRLRTLRSEHGSVVQAMIDAGHRAAQLAAQPVVDPAAAADAVQHAATLIGRGGELITEAGTAHDEMQGVLINPGRGQPRELMPDPPLAASPWRRSSPSTRSRRTQTAPSVTHRSRSTYSKAARRSPRPRRRCSTSSDCSG